MSPGGLQRIRIVLRIFSKKSYKKLEKSSFVKFKSKKLQN